MVNKNILSGLFFSMALGILALLITAYFSTLNSILIGLLLGISIRNFIKIPSRFQSGIGFTGGKFLEISVVLLAFGINYNHMAKLGWESFVIIAAVVFAIVFLTIFLAKKFNCPSSVGWLVGFGTAICGSSAIAALAPSVEKNKEDVGVAMAVVNLYGTIGMFLIPILAVTLSLSSTDTSLLLGGTLHAVGNVAGAGYAMSTEIGEQALTIKLARVALLSPGVILFNYITQRSKGNHWKTYFKLPWYLLGFILITILVSLIEFPAIFLDQMNLFGSIMLTIAMTAIGLKVSFKSLIQSGKRGLMFGLIIFIVQIGFVLGLLQLL